MCLKAFVVVGSYIQAQRGASYQGNIFYFSDTVSSSYYEYVVINVTIVSKEHIGNMEGSGRSLIYNTVPVLACRPSENNEKLHTGQQYPDRDSHSGRLTTIHK